MYNAKIRFLHVGIPATWVDAFACEKPQPNFTHTFEEAATLPDVIPLGTIALYFSNDSVTLSALQNRTDKANLVLCTDAPDNLSDETLQGVRALWPATMSARAAKSYFCRLLKNLKTAKEAWINDLYLNAVIDTEPDLVWFKAVDGRHMKVNDAFCAVVNKEKDDVRGKTHNYIWDLPPGEEETSCRKSEEEVYRTGKIGIAEENVKTPDGILILQTFKKPLYDEDGSVLGTVGIGKDITQLRNYEARLLRAANTDELTGLANRRYFYECINQQRSDRTLMIARVDLAYFKQLNDTYGSRKGDEALIAMAGYLKSVFPDVHLCRFGGGEFLLCKIGTPEPESFKERFQTVIEKINAFCDNDPSPLLLSANMGIAITSDPNMSLDKLVRQSDLALYYARNLGDAQCCLFSEIIGA